jgi:hypothetical protein
MTAAVETIWMRASALYVLTLDGVAVGSRASGTPSATTFPPKFLSAWSKQ